MEELPDEVDILIELGDRFLFVSEKYKETDGRIYYRSADLIRILPQGVSDRLYDFPLVDNDFAPELGVTDYYLIDKHRIEGFIEQQDFRAGQYFETFTADAEPAGNYTFVSVDPVADRAVVRDETGAELELDFNFTGVPLDVPFSIIRVREPPAPAAPAEEATMDLLEEQAAEEAEQGIALPEEAAAAAAAATVPPIAESDAEGGIAEAGAPAEEVNLDFTGFIAVPQFEQVEVIPTEQQIYPDVIQKADALQDFTTLLTVKEQQDVKALRRIRALTETLFALKQQLVEYNANGTTKGMRPTSLQTLRQLIDAAEVPLGRPVLDTAKRLYTLLSDIEDKNFTLIDNLDHDVGAPALNVSRASPAVRKTVIAAYQDARKRGLTETEVEQVVAEAMAQEPSAYTEENATNDDPLTIVDLREELEKMKNFLIPVAPAAGLATGSSFTIQFWIQLQAYMNEFMRPWTARGNSGADEAEEAQFHAQSDGEFFRRQIPDDETRPLRGLIPGGRPQDLVIDKIHYGLERALAATFRSASDKRRLVLFGAEGAPIRSYLLFPYKYKAQLGTTRTGLLATDSIHSSVVPKGMAQIIKETHGVQDTPTSAGILAIGTEGNTLGNIEIADYVATLALRGFGFAEMARELRHIGYTNFEFDERLGQVIVTKISSYINAVKNYIKILRERLAALPAETPVPQNLFPPEEMNWLLNDVIVGEPLLAEAKADFVKQTPRLAGSDFSVLSALIVKHYDYLLAAAGGQAEQIALERLRTTRNNFLRVLKAAVKVRNAIRGEAPQPNKCEHVNRLRDIRRIEDYPERMQHLAKFVVRFQGQRKDNYVLCSLCNRDLLCIHELIELKMFMNPREKETLRKELMLRFCGPVMGRTYQCRNCGQAMGEIEFDNSVEFDDEGRPMMGYAVLEDVDAQRIDEIDKVLGMKEEAAPTEMDFGLESRNAMYRVIREIADRVGVYPSKSDYDTMIGQIQSVLSDIGDRESFVATQAALASKLGKKVRLPDYDMVVNRTLVAAAGAYLLIHIQGKIPDYMPSGTLPGCRAPGFRGYPLEAEDNTMGQDYIACAISSIMRNTAPWNMTGFQKEESDAKRQKLIFAKVNAAIKDALEKPDVQLWLAAKRKYRAEIYGEGGETKDQISPYFLPPQHKITAADASAAGTVQIPEVTTDATVGARADIWIQIGNRIAAQTASERGEVVIGSPFAEATCCYGSIEKPQTFWEAAETRAKLPELPERKLAPGALVTRLFVRFSPRPLAELLAQPPENLFYILFLNVCFAGPRYGLPHEPGLNHKCPHCEFQFPSSVQFMDVEKEGKTALEAQNVEITKETFTALLDATHQRYAVPAYERPDLSGPFDTMRRLTELDPAPVEGWAAIIEETIAKFSALPPDASVANIQETLATLSDVGYNALRKLEGRLPEATMSVLRQFMEQPPAQLVELTLSYLIVPFQRLLTRLDPESLERLQPQLAEELSGQHIEDIVRNILQPNIYVQKRHVEQVGAASFAQAKLAYCVRQLQQVPALFQTITPSTIPGGERTIRYLLSGLILPPLASLLNPNEIPPGAPSQEATQILVDNSLRFLFDVVRSTFNKYRQEQKSYSDKEIRDLLQVRAEKEKAEIIKTFDRMTEDEKRVELLKKAIGMGRWAVGGSKKITQYDREFYDQERIQRAQAGISDFATGGFGPEGEPMPEGRPADQYGFYDFGPNDEFGAAEGSGYDVAQESPDDF